MSADARPPLVDALALLTSAIRVHRDHLEMLEAVTDESQQALMSILSDARAAVREAFDMLEAGAARRGRR